MQSWLRELLAGRPGWMNALMLFSGFMAFVYMPWDIFVKPVAEDQEVWFGLMFTGWGAKLTAPFHWAIYAAGAYGFRFMKSWMWPWAAIYVAQIAVGMLVWTLVYGPGGFGGFVVAAVAFVAFGALARALWWAQPAFRGEAESLAERYGGWAVVTGASSGLGAEFARALARGGVNCALSARRRERLEELARELEAGHGVETRVIPADLADPAAVGQLASAVEDLDVSIVVNNAGFGAAGRFAKLDAARLAEMIQVNCAAPVALTSRLLPKLCARGRGAVVITGSVAGRLPLPFHAVYSASKAFDLLFGEALAVELAEDGIDVLVVEPGPTETEFQSAAGEVAHPGQPPAEVVAVALAALGRQHTVVAGWKNWFRVLASRWAPRPLVAHLARDVMAAHTPADRR